MKGSKQFLAGHCHRFVAIAVGLYALTLSYCSALHVDFESAAAGSASTFSAVVPGTQDLVINLGSVSVTFVGGTLLRQASALPANTTGLYGTASAFNGLSNPLRILFSVPVANVSFNLYNGQTWNTLYQVGNGQGDPQSLKLNPNIFGGTSQVSLTGVTSEIDIRDASGRASWDFFVDNLQFDLVSVPDESGTLELLLIALLLLVGWHVRVFRTQASV